MSGELKQAVERVSSEKDKIKQDFTDIKEALQEKSVEVPEETHLSGVPDLIRSITSSSGGTSSLKIEITADEYEGATFTATHEDQETKATAKVSENSATINVPKGGTYTVSNDSDEQTKEATLIDSVNLEFFKFKATVKVTLPKELIGETITCTLEEETLEQKAESTEVTFTVKKKGNWKIGVKDNTYISATANVTETTEYPVSLSISSGVPVINITLDEELVGYTVKVSKDLINIEKKAETTNLKIVVKELGEYTVSLKEHFNVTTSVNVEQAKEYSAKLTIESGIPTITVRSKEEDNGKTVKCTKSQTVLEGVLKNRQYVFILPETGEWKITCDDYPEITKTVNVTENKAYRCSLRASTFGVKITESESDPASRVTYTDDAIDMSPVKITLEDGTVDYGEWKDTWIFEKIYPCMVKTDGSIAYKLNPDDQTKKAEGGASEITSTSFDGNALVCVEKFYTKFSMDGDDEIIQISDDQDDGFEPIGFIREDGSEADQVFLPMFMGSFDSSSKLRSLSGQDIKYSTSFTDFRTAAQKNGTTYDIEVYAMNQFLTALYLVLFKTCNWREALGEGRTYDNTTNKKTGVLVNKGGIAFDPTTKATKFLWIEDYVSWPKSGTAIYRWEAGILCKNKENYVAMKPPYSGTDVSGYEKVTDHVYISNQYISKMKSDNKYGRTPTAAQGSETTYECTYWYDNNSTNDSVYVSLRGNYYSVAGRNFNLAASYTYLNFGAALSLVPPA